jgi:hypothetical protein
MGFSRKRAGRDGRSRYTAYYLDIRGQERSAGTFSNKKDASDARKEAEAGVRAGRQGDPARGRQTFEAYVLGKWLPHHLLEPGVSSNYAGQIRKHLMPFFGPMKMRDIMPEHVRERITAMKPRTRPPGPSSTARGRSSAPSSPPPWQARSSPFTRATA